MDELLVYHIMGLPGNVYKNKIMFPQTVNLIQLKMYATVTPVLFAPEKQVWEHSGSLLFH
jgi:hypothetical protein